MALAAVAIGPAVALRAAVAPSPTADIRLQPPAAEAPWTATDARTTSPTVAKLWQLANSLAGSPEGAVIAVSSRSQDSLDATRADLEQFLVVMAPAIAATIDRGTTQ